MNLKRSLKLVTTKKKQSNVNLIERDFVITEKDVPIITHLKFVINLWLLESAQTLNVEKDIHTDAIASFNPNVDGAETADTSTESK